MTITIDFQTFTLVSIGVLTLLVLLIWRSVFVNIRLARYAVNDVQMRLAHVESILKQSPPEQQHKPQPDDLDRVIDEIQHPFRR